MYICIGCEFYDASVNCCNADEYCYQVGYEKGRTDAEPKWISVEDRLPDEQDDYLVLWKCKESKKCFYAICEYEFYEHEDYKGWVLDGYMDSYSDVKITHWMPLPQPPQKP